MRFWDLADFKGWPPGISNGLVSDCQVCAQRPTFDYQVDDDIWYRVVPGSMRSGVICLPCLDVLASEVGVDINQHMHEVQFAGCKSTLVLLPGFVVRRVE